MLKNNIFEFGEKAFKLLHRTTIEKTFAPPYTILFIADLEENIRNTFEEKSITRFFL